MKLLLVLLTSIIEGLIWFNISSLFLEKNNKKIINICLSMGLTLIIFVKTISSVIDTRYYIRFVFPILALLYIIWAVYKFFGGNTISKSMGVIAYVIGVGLTDLVIIILGNTLFGISVNEFSHVTYDGVIFSLLGKSLLLIVILTLKNVFRNKIRIYNKGRNIFIIMFLLNTILFMALYLVFISNKVIFSQQIVFVFLGVNLIITTVLTIIAYREMEKKSYLILKNELKLQHQEWELDHYKTIDEMYNKIRALQHDMNNYIAVIQSMLELRQYDELSKFLGELTDEFSEINEYVMTGNKILNVVLNTKRVIAQKKGIAFNLSIEVKKVELEDVEICSLFGNILDNAIEGCEEVLEPRIDLEIKDINNGIKVSCSNTCRREPIHELGKLKSTKACPEKHGIGSENIVNIVKRKNGTYTYDYQDTLFLLQIFLPKDVISHD